MLAWIISLTSMIMLYLMGNRWKHAPLIGVFNQALWVIFIIKTREYGLLPGVMGYTIIHMRNVKKWRYNA